MPSYKVPHTCRIRLLAADWDRTVFGVGVMKPIALVCVECGVILLRHPAMRERRVICLECRKKQKIVTQRARRMVRMQAVFNATKPPKPSS